MHVHASSPPMGRVRHGERDDPEWLGLGRQRRRGSRPCGHPRHSSRLGGKPSGPAGPGRHHRRGQLAGLSGRTGSGRPGGVCHRGVGPDERVVRRLPDAGPGPGPVRRHERSDPGRRVVAERCRADGHGCDQRRRRLRVGYRHGRAGEPGVRRLVRQLHRRVRPDGRAPVAAATSPSPWPATCWQCPGSTPARTR